MHIPFFPVETPSDEHLQEALKKAAVEASASIGDLISLGEKLTSPEAKKYIREKIIPFVQSTAQGMPYRVQKCYAVVLSAARLVTPPPPLTFNFQHLQLCKMGLASLPEVMEFFANIWAPQVVRIHQQNINTLSTFFSNIVEILKDKQI